MDIKQSIGKQEEDHVYAEVSSVPGVKVYRNLYVPCSGRYAEIDILVLSAKGVFIVEAKAFGGTITGNVTRYDWTRRYKRRGSSEVVTKFYNPIRQSSGHLQALSRYLCVPTKHMLGLIVFADRATLCKVPARTDNCVVLQTRFVTGYLKRCLASREVCFSPTELSRLEQRLDGFAGNTSDGVKRLHIIQARQAERRRKAEQERRRAARQKPRGSSKAPKL